MNESFSGGEDESPFRPGRMTRLRARGGIRDRPPIIDEDDEDMMLNPAPVVARRRKLPRRPPVERIERERPIVEKVVVERDREREEASQDETSLYFIIRNSKSAVAVNYFNIKLRISYLVLAKYGNCF